MPPSEASPENQIPLVVDLDGTLIKTDLLWEFLAKFLWQNPFSLFTALFWWTRGRAFLKKKLAGRVKIDPAPLPYNEKFIAFLREQKAAGRKLILATASDREMALPVSNHVGLFDEVLASDGKTNLRGANKLKALVGKFGERGFDYVGNSTADLAVWSGAREAVVVNASRSLVDRAARCAKVGKTFTENYSPFFTLRSFCNELFIRSGWLGAIVAGLLLAAAFPKVGIAGFAWVAPALMIFCAWGKNGGESFRVGYIAGLSFWLASLYWLLLIPYRWHSIPFGPAAGWLALCAYLALYPAIWVWLVSEDGGQKVADRSWSRRLLWSLGGAAVWVALEMIRARLLGGFPWNLLGVSQFKMIPLIQIASVTGVHGVSFLVVWASLSLFSAARSVFSKPATRFIWQGEIILPFLVVVALFMFGFVRMNGKNVSGETLRVTLVQPSVPQTLIWDENANSNRFQQLLALSENALKNKTDLLIWPESALPEFESSEANYAAITNFAATRRVWIVFNADDFVQKMNPGGDDKFDSFNSAFLFAPDGNCAAIYHKRKLVIFGEYIPFVRWLPFVKWLTPITGSYEAGNFPVQFEMNDLKIKTSPLICFEDMFPQTARKSVQGDTDFLVNLTNDGWFGQSAEQWQHMANSVFRAVENGVPLVRCCNNGVTCWIDANGRVREIFRDKNGSVYGVGSMTIDVPLPHPGENHAPAFYNLHGDWFGWLCVGITSILLVTKILRSGNRRSSAAKA